MLEPGDGQHDEVRNPALVLRSLVLGRQAARRRSDEATHDARKAAHAAFDSLWKSGPFSRAGAYKALAAIMGVKPADCHIALMSKEDAERVVAFAPRLRENAKHKVDRLGSNFIGLNPW